MKTLVTFGRFCAAALTTLLFAYAIEAGSRALHPASPTLFAPSLEAWQGSPYGATALVGPMSQLAIDGRGFQGTALAAEAGRDRPLTLSEEIQRRLDGAK